VTKELLGNLSPEHMKSLGQMLEQDWKDRPEWGEMAIAILKNDFMRPGSGWWKPSAKRYDWNWLSERFDANKDGKVDPDEFPTDLAKADQLFERLDRDGDGQLMSADFDFADPNPLTMMMNVSAMKNMMSNQLFNRLDKDSNGRVTMQELAEFFRYGDKEELEFLTPEDLRFAIDEPPSKKRASEVPDDNPASTGPSTPAAAFKMFLRGDMGWLTPGPQVGDAAPDFTLPKQDGTANVTLSDSFGKRPVVLVFGSFT
jgi:Ca2+-binding EF-hand superfamily protein